MTTSLFVKDAGKLSQSTGGLESHFIMFMPSQVIFEHFFFPYLYMLFFDIASTSRTMMPAALSYFVKNFISERFVLFV